MNYRQQMDKIAVYFGTITKIYHECAKLHGMSYNTLMVLGALRHYQTCTQKQIVEQWATKQSVNTIVKKFHSEQKIEFSHGRNNKEKLVAFTDKGKAFSDSVLEPMLMGKEVYHMYDYDFFYGNIIQNVDERLKAWQAKQK